MEFGTSKKEEKKVRFFFCPDLGSLGVVFM